LFHLDSVRAPHMNAIRTHDDASDDAFTDFTIDFAALRRYASSEEGYQALLTEAQNSLARWQRELEAQTDVPEHPEDFLHPMIGALSYLLSKRQMQTLKAQTTGKQPDEWSEKRNQILVLLTRLQKDLS
ncbi:MAG: hypothetical protein ACOCZ8_07110, partial [Bacteroidota bacterium]